MDRVAWVRLGLMAALLAGGCGCGGADESAADPQESDIKAGTQPIYVAVGTIAGGGDVPDLVQIQLAGRSKTTCEDGKKHATCAVAVDYQALGLTTNQEAGVDA